MTPPPLLALAAQAAPPALTVMLFPLLLMGGIFYFLLLRPQNKEKRRRTEMLRQIKKNDRVVTIGGIVGTVAIAGDTEITLKVDESNNTKITFSRSAIQKVVSVDTPNAAGLADSKP